MTKVTTILGGKEVEIDVPEATSLVLSGTKLDTTTLTSLSMLSVCAIPEPPDAVIQVPDPAVWGTITPSSFVDVPLSVIASMLPCDQEGLFPCPEIVIEKVKDAQGDNTSKIVFRNKDGRFRMEGELIVDFDVINKCCCDATDKDRIFVTPKIEWIPGDVFFPCSETLLSAVTPEEPPTSEVEIEKCLYLRRLPPIQLCGRLGLKTFHDDNSCITSIVPDFDLTLDGEIPCSEVVISATAPENSVNRSSITVTDSASIAAGVTLNAALTLDAAREEESCITHIIPDLDLHISGTVPCPDIIIPSTAIVQETPIFGSTLRTSLQLRSSKPNPDLCEIQLEPIFEQYLEPPLICPSTSISPTYSSVAIGNGTLSASLSFHIATDESCNTTVTPNLQLGLTATSLGCPEIMLESARATTAVGASTLEANLSFTTVTSEDCTITVTPNLQLYLTPPLECDNSCDVVPLSGAPIEIFKYGAETAYITPTLNVEKVTNEDSGKCEWRVTPELISAPRDPITIDCFEFQAGDSATDIAASKGFRVGATVSLEVDTNDKTNDDCTIVKYTPKVDISLEVPEEYEGGGCPDITSDMPLTSISGYTPSISFGGVTISVASALDIAKDTTDCAFRLAPQSGLKLSGTFKPINVGTGQPATLDIEGTSVTITPTIEVTEPQNPGETPDIKVNLSASPSEVKIPGKEIEVVTNVSFSNGSLHITKQKIKVLDTIGSPEIYTSSLGVNSVTFYELLEG